MIISYCETNSVSRQEAGGAIPEMNEEALADGYRPCKICMKEMWRQ